jgi:NAD(P)-dependent dehydrogenase (short-subunit alcohol dehydrogenase family)
MKLKGKRILVLGGTSGIGLAVAEAAMTEGSDVVVVSSQQRRIDAALTLLGKGAARASPRRWRLLPQPWLLSWRLCG